MEEHKPESKTKQPLFRRWFVVVPAMVLVVIGLAIGYVYAVSPGPIRKPQMEHFHFRLQVLVDGKAVDFSSPLFQNVYAKGQCTGDLTEQPIHFHDGKDQFVHIHWAGMTGGMVLKNYGWNFIGGRDGLLGYRIDDMPHLKAVPIHDNALPDVPNGANFWVYSGDEQGYQKRTLDDFKKQDLEKFFGKQSSFKTFATSNSLLGLLFPKAYAHGSQVNGDTSVDETEAERLTRINNLLGNVVIFVQKDQPTDAQIKARFASLEPLSDSTCGG